MLKVGDKVMVAIPPSELTAQQNVRQFDKTIHRITHVHKLPKQSEAQYNLEGCVGNCNQKYWFLPDWLIELSDEVNP